MKHGNPCAVRQPITDECVGADCELLRVFSGLQRGAVRGAAAFAGRTSPRIPSAYSARHSGAGGVKPSSIEQPAGVAPRPRRPPVQDMGIDLGGGHVAVSEGLLNGPRRWSGRAPAHGWPRSAPRAW